MTNEVSGITHRKVKVSRNFERSAFMFMRMSGMALLIFAVGHMMIQHVLNDVHNLTLQFVEQQWSSWGWKVYDFLLLLIALPHGINGLRNVLEDYIHGEMATKVVNVLLVLFLIVSLFGAGYAIISF